MIDALSMLNRTATIKRPTASVDASGTPAQTFVVLSMYVPCAITRKGQNEGRTYNRMTAIGTHTGLFLTTSDLDLKDRVVVGSQTYDVVGLNEPVDQDGSVSHVEADLELTE